MTLKIAAINSDDEIQRHKEDMRAAPHSCPLCGLKKMMTIAEIQDHTEVCIGRKRRCKR